MDENIQDFLGITAGLWGNTESVINDFITGYITNNETVEHQVEFLINEMHTWLVSDQFKNEIFYLQPREIQGYREALQRDLFVITGAIDKISEDTPSWLEPAILETYELRNISVGQEKIDLLRNDIARLPHDLQDALALIVYAINHATELCHQATANLTLAEIRFLEQTRETATSETTPDIPDLSAIFMDLVRGPLFNISDETENYEAARYRKIMEKIQVEKIIVSCIEVTDSIRTALPILLRYQNADFEFFFCDPLDLIIIGDTGQTTYDMNHILSIDLGGNDTYTNNAGGGYQEVAVSIDLGGDDIYRGIKNCQGSGFLGIGILVDIAGNDTYHSQSWSQGAACGGVGALLDVQGDDLYLSDKYSQGSATARGIGIAVDYQGDDLWCSTTFSQGKASEEGLGCLLDALGNDLYVATRDSQGRGFNQGKGLLLDVLGNDGYMAEKKSQGCGECGGKNEASIGILLDTAGDDSYKADQASQGYGRHSGIGMLFDVMGNDNYSAQKTSQAFGGLIGMGVLMDFWGDDAYSKIDRLTYFGIGLAFQLDTGGTNQYFVPGQNYTSVIETMRTNISALLEKWIPGIWNREKSEIRDNFFE